MMIGLIKLRRKKTGLLWRSYSLSLDEIIPSQDGFMPLVKVIKDKNTNIADLFNKFNHIALKKFDLNIKWDFKKDLMKQYLLRLAILSLLIYRLPI